MSLPSREKIYGNCKVLHPDGTLMFRCDDDRVEWYLNRNLAEVVSLEGEPLTIRFTFEPKGRGHIGDPFYLQEKENRCVVCGSTELLTRHHAVPFCYRKHFPEHLKSRCCHDILPVCVECHEKYEREAIKLKKQIAAKYDVHPDGGSPNLPWTHAKSAANALVKYGEKIPADRKELLKLRIAEYLNKEKVNEEDILEIAMVPSRRRGTRKFSHGFEIVEKLDDLYEFTIMWRQHFLDVMNPQFMSEHWDVNKVHENDQIKTRAS